MIVEYSGRPGPPLEDFGTHQWHTVLVKDDPSSNIWLVSGVCSGCGQWFRSCWPDNTECQATLRLTPVRAQSNSPRHRLRTIR